jgi:hypothetical protein
MATQFKSSELACYVCGREGRHIGEDRREVYLEDDDQRAVYVGPTCFKNVASAGALGLRSAKGRGPRVFSTYELARAYAGALAEGTAS